MTMPSDGPQNSGGAGSQEFDGWHPVNGNRQPHPTEDIMHSRERHTLAQRRAAALSALLTQYPTERIEQLAGDLNAKRLLEAWEGVLDVAQYLGTEEVNNLCRVMVLIGYIMGHETALCYDKMTWFEGVAG